MTEPTPRFIANTDQPMRHRWPADVFVQGGSRGLVVGRSLDDVYQTAFVEAFPRNPDTFLRGEGKTIADAEDALWAKYERMNGCAAAPAHGPFEARQYRNGGGFCTVCGTWFSRVVPPAPADDQDAVEPAVNPVMSALFGPDRAAAGDTAIAVVELMSRVDELPDKPEPAPGTTGEGDTHA